MAAVGLGLALATAGRGDRLLAKRPVDAVGIVAVPLLLIVAHGGLGDRLDRGLVPLEQRVTLELGLHDVAQLDVGKLEQADSLLQLGGHHQPLALPHFPFG